MAAPPRAAGKWSFSVRDERVLVPSMNYPPEAADRPVPRPSPEALPFWEGCRRHELWIQRCTRCSEPFFYPRFHCPSCLSSALEWFQTRGRGCLYSYVINYRAPAGFSAPYVIAVVALEEGPRMVGNLVGVEPDPARLLIDMPLEVVFHDLTPAVSIPDWKPASLAGEPA